MRGLLRLQRRDNAINWIYEVRSTEDRKTTMKKLRSLIVGIDSGDEVLFEDFEGGGEMWTGRGQRERRRRIKFSEKYLSVPNVQLSISLWDMDAGSVLRVDVTAESAPKRALIWCFALGGILKSRVSVSRGRPWASLKMQMLGMLADPA